MTDYATGYRAGMEAAAGIAKAPIKRKSFTGRVLMDRPKTVEEIVRHILAALPSPPPNSAPEVCEWKFREYGDDGKWWYGTGCGCLERATTGAYCQCCGRKISVKEGP